ALRLVDPLGEDLLHVGLGKGLLGGDRKERGGRGRRRRRRRAATATAATTTTSSSSAGGKQQSGGETIFADQRSLPIAATARPSRDWNSAGFNPFGSRAAR